MIPPCKDCKDRHIGCHAACERYQAYRVQQEEISRMRRLGVEERISYLDYKNEKTKRLGGNNEQR